MHLEIERQYAYNRWANRVMLDSVAELTVEERNRELGGSFPTLHSTLVHMSSAEWIWLKRWSGTSPDAIPPEWLAANFDELRALWADVEDSQAAFLAGCSEERLHEPICYRTLGGLENEAPLGQLMQHVVNHATYHRGQIALLTRQLGHRPPSTDLVLYHREVKEGVA